MRRVLLLLFAAALGAAAATFLTSQSQPTRTVTVGSGKTGEVYVGEVGVLRPPGRLANRPKLVLPRSSLKLPGRYPLGSTVSFNVPIRNDGKRDLRITKLESG